MLRKSLALLAYENSLLRNSQLLDVTNQFNLISFGQIQQTCQQQPQHLQQLQQSEQTQQQPQQLQQLQQSEQTQQQLQQLQQSEQTQQPNYETLGHDEYVNFTPPHQTEEIQILTATPPTNLQTAGLFSDIEKIDFETFIVNFSHSLQPFDLN